MVEFKVKEMHYFFKITYKEMHFIYGALFKIFTNLIFLFSKIIFINYSFEN